MLNVVGVVANGRVVAALLLTATLPCCSASPNTGFVADAHARYEQRVLRERPQLVRVSAAPGRARRVAYRGPGGPGSGRFTLSPSTPAAGDPAFEREKTQTERREREIRQSIERVCRTC